jgi:hypothetical protein
VSWILFRDVDYEGSDIIAMFEDPGEAEKWLAWCKENRHDLRHSLLDEEPRKTWKAMGFQSYPGDDYHLEHWEPRPKGVGPIIL